ncbi:MAG: nucleotidyltransferase family protein [Oscillospiraceae bacterium]|nr:nucleotidyltransferase family protein [Oscillospiraceae bacterium]
MPTVAIVAEYNPFHNGHFYQIQKIREIVPEATIVSIMSGSLVQRGELAVFSKYDRAEIAARNGVDAVFELPSVYSCAPANIFCSSAIYMMQKLSKIDYICFGSECGELSPLEFAADELMSQKFCAGLSERIKKEKNRSYPNSVYNLFCELHGEKKAEVLLGSNDILAIEYLKALKKMGSTIKPLAIKRVGEDFKSAGQIRKLIRYNIPECKSLMPKTAYDMSRDLVMTGCVANIKNLNAAIISHLNRLSPENIAEFAEVSWGDEHKIKNALNDCFDLDTLFFRLKSKHKSESSVRRMILNVFFGITKELKSTSPEFATVLALNQKGAKYIHDIKKTAEIKIITKPADIKNNKIFDQNRFIDNTCKFALRSVGPKTDEIKQKPRLV